jgi:SAM-dependent methyltransferase
MKAARPQAHVARGPSRNEFTRLASPEDMAVSAAQLYRKAAAMLTVGWMDAVVLDVACGRYQYVVDELWQTARARFGADISFDAAAANTDVTAVCADMYALPFRTASADVLVSLDTIEHAAAPDRFLAEVGRVLRGGGSAVVITPNLIGYHALVAKLIGNFGAELVWRLLKGRSLPYDLYYRANTIRRLSAIGARFGLRVGEVVYVPTIQHFFWGSALLRRFWYDYHRLVTALRMPWLLPTMIVHLRKDQDH